MTVTVFGVNARGGRNVGVTVDGISATIFSNGPEDDAACVRLAESLIGELALKWAHEAALDTANGAIRRLKVELEGARDALRCAAEGRRRFFGPVLCVPVVDGDWSGEVWLLDPEKLDHGYGLRFASLLELRALHPELWIVGTTARGVLLDAVKLEQREVPG